MPQRADIIPIALPFKGLHRGLPHSTRPLMTTENAMNVRGFSPVNNRYELAKRAGTSKRIASAMGESGSRRVNHVATMPKASETPSSGTGTYVLVQKSFVADKVGDPTDIGEDLVVFLKQYSTAGHYVTNNYDWQVNDIDLSASSGAPLGTAKGGGLVLDWIAANGYPGVAATYGTTNDCTICFYAAFQATTDNDNVGKVGEPINFGPFVRGSGDLKDFIGACLLYDGATTAVKLAIIKVSGATRTTLLEQSVPVALDDQDWATSKGVGIRGDMCIRCYATDTTVTAELSWPSADINRAPDPPGIGPFPLMKGNDPFRITVTNSDFSTNNRCGGAALFTATTVPTGSDTTNRWYIKGISFTKFVPRDADVAYQLTRAAGVITPPPERYYLPSTAVGVKVTTGGTVTTFTATSQTTDPGEPSLDTQNIPAAGETGSGFVSGGGTSSASAFIYPTPTWTEQYAVECRGKAEPGDQNTEDVMGAAFRIQSGNASAVLIEVLHGSDANYKTTKQDSFSSVRVVQVLNGVRTAITSLSTANADLPPFKSVHWHRFTDNGANGASAAIDLGWGQNGIIIKTFAGVQASLDAVFDAPQFRCGSSFYGNNGASEFTYAFGMRLVDTTNSSATQIGETECRYAAFTNGYVDVGVLQDGDVNRCDGLGLQNPVVSSTVLGTKWFAVDGLSNKVIDPINKTVSDWVATIGLGEVPQHCRLAATYRRSIVLARQTEDPTLWYIGRTEDPYDWDFGADPEETAPIAGNNGIVGQPADPINALIAVDNDMLIFGCPSSIFRLEGDPRINGQLQVLTRSTGIIGPRAWCFDGQGTLWFMGISGLYRLPLGAPEPENISKERLVSVLDHLNAEALFVQMAYDPYDSTIRIFTTPVDGVTVGTHVVYDIRQDAFWTDQLPLEHGPWSVAQPYGSNSVDRRPVFGGNDGYLRSFSDAATSDDGTSIDSYVDIFIDDADSSFRESMIDELHCDGGASSGTFGWKWFTGASQVELSPVTTGEVDSGTFGAGYQTPRSIRRTGASHKVRLYQSSSTLVWSVDRMGITRAKMGRRR